MRVTVLVVLLMFTALNPKPLFAADDLLTTPNLLLSDQKDRNEAVEQAELENALPPAPQSTKEKEKKEQEEDEDRSPDAAHVLPDSPLNFAFNISGMWTTYSNYVAVTGTSTIDNQLTGGFEIEFEWLPITSYGKVGVGIGAGFTTVSNIPYSDGSGNTASLRTLPLEFYLSYRLDYWKNQWLVPYGRIGGEMQLTSENVSTGLNGGGFPLYLGYQFAAGLEFCLNILEPVTAKSIDAIYGINNTYLYFEFIDAMALHADQVPDLSRYEYRIGLRVEF